MKYLLLLYHDEHHRAVQRLQVMVEAADLARLKLIDPIRSQMNSWAKKKGRRNCFRGHSSNRGSPTLDNLRNFF